MQNGNEINCIQEWLALFHLVIILQNLMCIKIVEYKILEQALDKSIKNDFINDFIALKPKQVYVFLYSTVIVSIVTTRKW